MNITITTANAYLYGILTVLIYQLLIIAYTAIKQACSRLHIHNHGITLQKDRDASGSHLHSSAPHLPR